MNKSLKKRQPVFIRPLTPALLSLVLIASLFFPFLPGQEARKLNQPMLWSIAGYSRWLNQL